MIFLKVFLLICLPIAMAWLVFSADRKRNLRYPWLLALIRGLLTFVCLYLLLGPKINKRSTEIKKPLIVLLQDNSLSVANALGDRLQDYKKDLANLEKDMGGNYKFVRWGLDGPVAKDSPIQYKESFTDISSSIQKISEQYSGQNLCALILASDGQYNVGENPLYSKLPINTTAYSLAIGDTSSPIDIKITKVLHNRTASLNSQSEVNVHVQASGLNGKTTTLKLLDGKGQTLATQTIGINSAHFDKSLSFIVEHKSAGLQKYQLSISPTGEEQNLYNNNNTFYIEVQEKKKKVLIAAAAPHPDLYAIKAALKDEQHYSIDTRIGAEVPNNTDEYDIIIAHQIPAKNWGFHPDRTLHKNVWFILGSQNDLIHFNGAQGYAMFQSAPAPQNSSPILNSGFSSFTLPSSLGATAEKFPPLQCPSMRYTLKAPHEDLFSTTPEQGLWSFVPGEENVVFTFGEGLWRWRMYTFRYTGSHELFDQLVKQTLQFLTNTNHQKAFRTDMVKSLWSENEQIGINAYLKNQNNELINEPEAVLEVKNDSTAKVYRLDFERINNIYHADIGALPAGHYSYKANSTYQNKKLEDRGSFEVNEQLLESMESGCDYNLLFQFARQNEGSTVLSSQIGQLKNLIQQNTNVKPLIIEKEEQLELINWKWLFFLIVLLASIEWLLRKYWMAM